MDFSDEVKRRVAFHEAGHLWMMMHEKLGVLSSTIDTGRSATGDTRGLTVAETPMEENMPELARRFARAALSGSLAEHFLIGQWDEEVLQARGFDNGMAASFLSMSGQEWSPEIMESTIHSLSNTVLNEISQLRAWHTITLIAYAFMEKGSLTGEDVAELLEEESWT
jgi:hypothetical protein